MRSFPVGVYWVRYRIRSPQYNATSYVIKVAECSLSTEQGETESREG